jgi:hypothetical protein
MSMDKISRLVNQMCTLLKVIESNSARRISLHCHLMSKDALSYAEWQSLMSINSNVSIADSSTHNQILSER